MGRTPVLRAWALLFFGSFAPTIAIAGCGRTALEVEHDGGGGLDGSPRDAGVDARASDAGRDALVPDAFVPDTGLDAFSPDAFSPDTGHDAFVPDAGGCTTDTQCDDGRFCDGVERCVLGRCTAGTPIGCVSDTCSVGTCSDALRRCVTTPVDRDRDGHVPRTCGGDDCNDADASSFPGAPERCTGSVDEDCDGLADCMDPSCAADPACRMPTCPDRVLGSSLGVIAMGTTVGAGADTQGGCAPTMSAPELSFQWTAPATGTYSFDTRGSSYDTVLYARAGCLGAELGCNDDGGGGTASLIRFALVAGQTIVLFVDGWGSSSGAFVLRATLESSAENCTNGVDDDADGLADCADPDCAGAPTCCVPAPESCGNGRDDDCDRVVDCMDPDCVASPICCVPMAESCTNGRDDDCDGRVDCSDTECLALPICCVPAPETCGNGRDDDCNGLTDCADPACTTAPACCVPRTEICTNGTDDDCDGLADCSDSGCATDPSCRVCPDMDLGTATGLGVARGMPSGVSDMMATCGGMARGPETSYGWTAPRAATWILDTNGSSYDTVLYVLSGSCTGPQLACDDDAGDGNASRLTVTLRAGQHVVIVVDAFNVTVSGTYVLNITHVTTETGACRDGVDNDADGFVDCVDPDCASDALCCTPRPEVCGDGIDNDCDRATDCMDPNCSGAPECCMPTMEACGDFADNDCDGLIDCVDPSCTGVPPC